LLAQIVAVINSSLIAVIALEVKAAERGYSHEEGEDKIELDSMNHHRLL
jgi:hypothetical protein